MHVPHTWQHKQLCLSGPMKGSKRQGPSASPAAQGENKGFLVAKQKSQTTVERLCRFHTAPFAQFLDYVLGLGFKEAPNYRACQQLFEALLEEPTQRPMAREYQIAAQARVRLRLFCVTGGSLAARGALDAAFWQQLRAPLELPLQQPMQSPGCRTCFRVTCQPCDCCL